MIVDISGGLLPFNSGIFEVTDQLPLFCIHAQDRIAALFEPVTLSAEIAELAVTVGSRTGGNPLSVRAQGILHLPPEPSHCGSANSNSQPLELSANLVCGVSGPFPP